MAEEAGKAEKQAEADKAIRAATEDALKKVAEKAEETDSTHRVPAAKAAAGAKAEVKIKMLDNITELS